MRFANFMTELIAQRHLVCDKKDGRTQCALRIDGTSVHISYDALLQDRPAQLYAPITIMARAAHLRGMLLGKMLEFNHKIARQHMGMRLTDEHILLERLVYPCDEPKRFFISLLMRFAAIAQGARTHLAQHLPKTVTL